MYATAPESITDGEYLSHLRSGRGVMNLLSGKWEIPIITVLITDSYGFNEMRKEIEGISAKMRSWPQDRRK